MQRVFLCELKETISTTSVLAIFRFMKTISWTSRGFIRICRYLLNIRLILDINIIEKCLNLVIIKDYTLNNRLKISKKSVDFKDFRE